MRTLILSVVWLVLATQAMAQTSRDPIEIPIEVVDGRLVVMAEAPDGSRHPFLMGLGMPLVSETAAATPRPSTAGRARGRPQAIPRISMRP